jgi:trehalose 6-phosphate synthase
VSFTAEDDGSLTLRRGGGGLVSGLTALSGGTEALWVCAALKDTDRRAARAAPGGRLDLDGHDTGGHAVRMLAIDPGTFQRAYNEVANSTLWFLHHLLFDTSQRPSFDTAFRREWASYVDYNRVFAQALAQDAAPGAKVMVQDYHLSLVPQLLRELRPDLRIAHFSHTPWAPADYYAMLPDDVGRQVLTGMLGANHIGFHSRRWAVAFLDCCARFLRAPVRREVLEVDWDGRTTKLALHPLGVDGESLVERSRHADVESHVAALREDIGERTVIVRVDRTELSKNILRGLQAYRELLRRYPEWHGRVVHLALAYPSRHDLPEYREYTAAVQRLAMEIDDEFSTGDWRALDLRVDDNYARSLAAYRLADVLIVNPIRDGMNLVAKEVPVVSDHGFALVLSCEAGVADEFAEDAIIINPYDVSSTADALDTALRTTPEQRRASCAGMRRRAVALTPQRWFSDQVAALD